MIKIKLLLYFVVSADHYSVGAEQFDFYYVRSEIIFENFVS